jgi:hypothetical protein
MGWSDANSGECNLYQLESEDSEPWDTRFFKCECNQEFLTLAILGRFSQKSLEQELAPLSICWVDAEGFGWRA